MHAPTLVLLDEPFTGLDDRAVGIVATRFRHLASTGVILVVATHDLDVADGLITRMAVMQAGKLLQASEAGTNVRQQYRALVGAA
jgi:ABC-type multidrug transport system ATPase subunit